MSIKIEPVTPKVQLGEGPFWDTDFQCLYFVDVFAKYINKYTPSTNSYTKALVPTTGDSNISSVTPIDGQKDQFLIGGGNELFKIHWDGVSDKVDRLEVVAELKKGNFWNDARVDFSGRLWIGYFPADLSTGSFVVPEKGGELFTVQSNRALKKRADGISMPNGLDWNKTQNSFYFVDSLAKELQKFDYDPKSDEISNKQVLFHFGDNNIGGIPDGMAIDENDNLWVATYGGRTIVNIDTKKPNTLIQKIDMPVDYITSVAFGGPNLDELYATSISVNPLEAFKPIDGGYVYKITGLGVKGYPGRKVKL